MVKDNFENDLCKLMDNAVFGKMMGKIRKHSDIKLMMNEKVNLKKVAKLNFEGKLKLSENLTGCEMGKIRILMNKPIYFGQNILNLSKKVM